MRKRWKQIGILGRAKQYDEEYRIRLPEEVTG